MRILAFIVVLTAVCATDTLADVEAVSFHMAKKVDLKKLLKTGKKLEDLSKKDMDDLAIFQGRFEGPCKLYLKNKDIQFRIEIKAIKDGAKLSYSLSLYSSEKEVSYGDSGAVDPSNAFSAKPDWDSPLSENPYVVIFKKVNLKK